jgi:hypothetical protein
VINLRLYVFLFISVLVSSCSSGVFLRPSTTGGELVKSNPACPGPKNGIEFSFKNKDWLHLRIFALLPRQTGDGTRLAFEVMIYPSLSLPKSKWQIDEFKNRKHDIYLFSASKPEVVLIRANGSKSTIHAQVFSGERRLQPNDTSYLLEDRIILSDVELTNFTVELPSISIDGESIDIPPIHFTPDQEFQAPVLNC